MDFIKQKIEELEKKVSNFRFKKQVPSSNAPQPEQTQPSQAQPSQAQPSQAQPEQAQPEQAQPEQAQSEQLASQSENQATSAEHLEKLWQDHFYFGWKHERAHRLELFDEWIADTVPQEKVELPIKIKYSLEYIRGALMTSNSAKEWDMLTRYFRAQMLAHRQRKFDTQKEEIYKHFASEASVPEFLPFDQLGGFVSELRSICDTEQEWKALLQENQVLKKCQEKYQLWLKRVNCVSECDEIPDLLFFVPELLFTEREREYMSSPVIDLLYQLQNLEYSDAFDKACIVGNLEVAKLMYEQGVKRSQIGSYELTNAQLSTKNGEILEWMCQLSHWDLVRTQSFPINEEDFYQ